MYIGLWVPIGLKGLTVTVHVSKSLDCPRNEKLSHLILHMHARTIPMHRHLLRNFVQRLFKSRLLYESGDYSRAATIRERRLFLSSLLDTAEVEESDHFANVEEDRNELEENEVVLKGC